MFIVTYHIIYLFFFSSRRRHTRYWRDWSSDVCSSDLVALQIQELVAGHIVRQNVASFGFQHGREHDAVKHDIVFADEVNEACFRVFPPSLPTVGKQLLRIRDVSDRRVEPYRSEEHTSELQS